MKKLVVLFILLQIGIIAFLRTTIYNRRVKGASTVAIPVSKENIQYTPNPDLEFYYEPKASTHYQITNDIVKNDATYLINSDTLNERFEYQVQKQKGAYRIIALGDSYTFGLYVQTADNWTEKLEDSLNTNAPCPHYGSYEVINLGVHGYDVQYEVERYKLRGVKYSPDLVLWLTKYDDYTQIYETLSKKLDMYEEEMRASGEYDQKLKEGIAHPAWWKAVNEVYELLGQENITEHITESFQDFAHIYSGPLIMLNFEYESDEVKNFYREMTKIQPRGIYYDGLTNIYKDQNNFFKDDGHPTLMGHEIMADDVYQFLIKSDQFCN